MAEKEIKKTKYKYGKFEAQAECWSCGGEGEIKDEYFNGGLFTNAHWTYKKCLDCNGTGKNIFTCIFCGWKFKESVSPQEVSDFIAQALLSVRNEALREAEEAGDLIAWDFPEHECPTLKDQTSICKWNEHEGRFDAVKKYRAKIRSLRTKE